MKKLGALLLAAAMLVMLVPTVWGADIDSEDDFDSAVEGIFTLTEDSELTTQIPSDITIVVPAGLTLSIPNPATLMVGTSGNIRILGGGSLSVSGNTLVGTNGHLDVGADGSLLIGFSNGAINVDLESGTATVPTGKKWTTILGDEDAPVRVPMNTTIASGAILTVEGEFRAANDSTVTVNGTIEVANGGKVRVSSKGEVNGSGSINVQSGGTIDLRASDEGRQTASVSQGMISIGPDSIVESAFDATLAFADGVKLIQNPNGAGYIVDEATIPGANTPVVNRPSFTIVQRPAVEYWASPESSNPTEEWAEPTTPSTDSDKTNPSMGGAL